MRLFGLVLALALALVPLAALWANLRLGVAIALPAGADPHLVPTSDVIRLPRRPSWRSA